LTLESRQTELKIDFEAIESIVETKDGRLCLIYFKTGGQGFKKKEDTFECFEIHDIIKCYQSIRNIVQAAEEGDDNIRYQKS
jgi:hypothetical protein